MNALNKNPIRTHVLTDVLLLSASTLYGQEYLHYALDPHKQFVSEHVF